MKVNAHVTVIKKNCRAGGNWHVQLPEKLRTSSLTIQSSGGHVKLRMSGKIFLPPMDTSYLLCHFGM